MEKTSDPELPSGFPLSYEDWEKRAREVLNEEQFAYIHAGAGTGDSIDTSLEAFKRVRLLPRVLRDVSNRTLAVSLFGREISAPLILAPVRGLKYIHRGGEAGSARAAARSGIPFVLSNFASETIEAIASVMVDTPRWLQLYPCKDIEVMTSFIHRAEKSGYTAIVLTVDMTGHSVKYFGPKTSEYDKHGSDVYFSDPIFRSRLKSSPETDKESAVKFWHEIRYTAAFSWKDLDLVRAVTKLPVLLKGILHPSDAEEAMKHKIDGLIVSNHGGRSLQGVEAPLEVLPKVCAATQGRIPILLDSGIRSGSDAIKALALGADAVLVGKSYAYGLAVAGEEGVTKVIQQLVKEMSDALALCGCASIDELDETFLTRN